MILALIIIMAGVLLRLRLKLKAAAVKAVLFFAVSTTGFFSMAVNLALIYSFQISYGYVYRMIGALTAIFMAGAAAGSAVSGSINIKGREPHLKKLAVIESGMVLFTIVVLSALSGIHWAPYMQTLHIILFFFAGVLTGAEFPPAVSVYSANKEEGAWSAGAIFCTDLVGGVLAALAAGVILLPLLGIEKTLVVLLFLKAVSAAGIMSLKKTK